MLLPKKYRTSFAISLIVIISLFMIFFSLRDASTGVFRKTFLEIVSSLETVTNMPLKGLQLIWTRYIFLAGLEEDNRRLRGKNARLTDELIKYREGYLENARLQQILKLRDLMPYNSIAARVVGRNPSSIFQIILINRGESDGLRTGLPVVATLGVVGRILETSWNVSRVLLMVDENSHIDAIVQEGRVQGMLQGAASAGCNLKYVPKSASVNIGDVVLSSGLGGVFPKGLPLGIVRKVSKKEAELFQRVNVAPFADPAGIEEVLVIMMDKGKLK